MDAREMGRQAKKRERGTEAREIVLITSKSLILLGIPAKEEDAKERETGREREGEMLRGGQSVGCYKRIPPCQIPLSEPTALRPRCDYTHTHTRWCTHPQAH